MKKEIAVKRKMIIPILLATSTLLGCSSIQSSDREGKAAPTGHPPLTAQEMLIACADCHQTETPDIYTEWFESLHGIGMVKCYQCHGTFENLVTVPDKKVCFVCHSAAMEKCPPDKACWECHIPHSFKAHK